MTAVVGLVDKGKVWIGADSCASNDVTQSLRRCPKVFVNGPMLIAGTTSFRMLDLLQYSLAVPKQDDEETLEQYMRTTFIDAIRECFKEGGFLSKQNNQEGGGSFLVGTQGRLFKVDSDYQVGESDHEYDAVGAGEAVCLGALHATSGRKPRYRITLALKAAEAHSCGVRGPFVIESI